MAVNYNGLHILRPGDPLPEHYVTVNSDGVTLYIDLNDLVDHAKEYARQLRIQKDLHKRIERGEQLLANDGFVERANPEVVQREWEQLNKARIDLAAVETRLAELTEHQNGG